MKPFGQNRGDDVILNRSSREALELVRRVVRVEKLQLAARVRGLHRGNRYSPWVKP